jgi:hypothetical protein
VPLESGLALASNDIGGCGVSDDDVGSTWMHKYPLAAIRTMMLATKVLGVMKNRSGWRR